MNRKCKIKLKAKERNRLTELVKKGTEKARKINRARVLLMMNDGLAKTVIEEALGLTPTTIRNICYRFLDKGLDSALNEKPRSGQPTIFSGKTKAQITALACSEAPGGRSQWSLRLLSDKAIELGIVEQISHTQVGRILKKTK